jgi:WD40 repeat protein
MSICFNQQTSLFVNNSVPLSEDQISHSVTCADDGNIRVSIPTLACELSLKPLSPLHRISNPTFDSSTVYYPSRLRIQIWSLHTQTLCSLLTGHTAEVYTLDFSPDGRLIVSGSGDGTMGVWNVNDIHNALTIELTQGQRQVFVIDVPPSDVQVSTVL